MTDPTTDVAMTMQPDPARSSYMPRIEMLIACCCEASMEEPFLVALARYLAGQGPLVTVMQEWQTHPRNDGGYYGPRDFYGCYWREKVF